MKAMAIRRFHEALEPMNLPYPEPGSGEVVLSVGACGVCRTDFKVIHGQLPLVRRATMPLAPGHEIVGTVEAVGPDVEGWSQGDRAVVYFYIGCGQCPPCRVGRITLCRDLRHQIGFDINGGYATKVRVPARNLVRISDRVPDREAAIIPDAIATAVHAVVDVAGVKPGDRVLVLGAGGVGIHVLQLVRLSGGYSAVVDIDEAKLALAREMGADEVHLVAGLDRLPASLRANTLIEASGALRDLGPVCSVLESGGTMVMVGYAVGETLTIGSLDIVASEFQVKGSRAAYPANLATAVDLVERGAVRPVVEAVFPLGAANEVLSKLSAGELKGRAVLVPD